VMGANETLSPTAVQALVREAGVDASINAVRNHLTRLADEGRLMRWPDGRFGEPEPDFSDDVPF
jgi:hypothetical protein